ncbi:MAG: hypothetical protein JRI77_09990 [Deltaproteobacteria bacterium]|nr:hypothetical protein [Deltaproteobacteria bacterium]
MLGINKQLDLQTFMMAMGRNLARISGWYSRRREIQSEFVALITVIGTLTIGLLFWWVRKRLRQFLVPLVGLIIIFAFVDIRAASFNHVDYFISNWRTVGPIRMKYAIELAGIFIIILGAFQAVTRQRRSH